jgi:hypothetical protein
MLPIISRRAVFRIIVGFVIRFPGNELFSNYILLTISPAKITASEAVRK